MFYIRRAINMIGVFRAMALIVAIIFAVLHSTYVMAIVPVIDQNQQSQDVATSADYFARLGQLITDLSYTKNSLTQLNDISNIITLEGQITKLCAVTYYERNNGLNDCSQQDMTYLAAQLNDINNQLVTHFDQFAHFSRDEVTTLSDLQQAISQFMTTPAASAKEITLSVNQAALEVNTNIQNTLLQLKTLNLHDQELKRVEGLIEQNNNNQIINGLKNGGL